MADPRLVTNPRADLELQVDATGQPFIEIAGRRVDVVDPAEAEQATFVVCGSVSYFTDDVHTTCAYCGRPVVHRPHAPAAPPKICLECTPLTLATGEES